MFITRVTSYCLFHKWRVTFCIRVTSYCLLHNLGITFIAHCRRYELLFIAPVTSYYFIARVTFLKSFVLFIIDPFLTWKMFWKLDLLKYYEHIKKKLLKEKHHAIVNWLRDIYDIPDWTFYQTVTWEVYSWVFLCITYQRKAMIHLCN